MTMPRIPLVDTRRGDNKPETEEERKRRMAGQGGGQGLLSPFLPGDKGLLARQLAQGFGGDPQSYMKQLSMMYQPMQMGFNFGGGGFGRMGGGGGAPQPPTLPPNGLTPVSGPRLSPVGWSR